MSTREGALLIKADITFKVDENDHPDVDLQLLRDMVEHLLGKQLAGKALCDNVTLYIGDIQ